MIGTIKHGAVTSMQDERAYRFARSRPLRFGRVIFWALLIRLFASLYRGGFA